MLQTDLEACSATGFEQVRQWGAKILFIMGSARMSFSRGHDQLLRVAARWEAMPVQVHAPVR